MRVPSLLLVLALAGCGDELVETMIPRVASDVVRLATPAERARVDVVAGSYVVAFRGEPAGGVPRFTSFAREYRHHADALSGLRSDPRVQSIDYVAAVNLNEPRDAQGPAPAAPPTQQLAFDAASLPPAVARLAVVRFAPEAESEVLSEWERDRRLWFAEPNYAYTPSQETPIATYSAPMAEAYDAAGVWWHKSIGLYEALNALASRGIASPSSPIVAVLDSGVDMLNSALVGKVWENPAKDGKSGCPGDLYGCNTTVAEKGRFGDGKVNPYLTSDFGQTCPGSDAKEGSTAKQEAGTCSHGTHVAGIIAAKVEGTGDAGIGGACPVCRVMAIRIIGDVEGVGRATSAAILNALKYLTQFETPKGNSAVRIVNSSFGNYTRSRAQALLVTVLSRAPHQILVIGAAGNEDSMIRSYPAAYPEAIAVAALGSDDGKASYSNFGPWVTVAAPGGDGNRRLARINSTIPGVGGRGEKNGTSMAAPVVAAVAGLILSVDPGRSFADLRNSIVRTADPRIYNADVYGGINRDYYYQQLEGDTGRSPLLGSGVVSALHAIDNDRNTGIAQAGFSTVEPLCGIVPGRQALPRSALALALALVVGLLPAAVLPLTRRPS